MFDPVAFSKQWQEAVGFHWLERVVKIKRIFRVSYKTILFRLVEKKYTDNAVWKKFNIAYQKKYNKKLGYKQEPFGLRDFDFFPERFANLVKEAVKKAQGKK